MTDVATIAESNFPSFVADLWERQGWTTQIKAVDGEHYVAAVQKDPEPERGLIWAKSGTTGARVASDAVVTFAKFCRENGVDDAGILTLGEFTEDGRTAAEKFGIDLVDGKQLAALVERHGLDDLVARHANPAGGGGGSSTGDSPIDAVKTALASVTESMDGLGVPGIPTGALDGVRSQLASRGISVSPKVLVGVLAVVAVVVAGVVVGPSMLGALPFVGGGGGGPATAANVSLSADPVMPGGAATSLYVEWNAVSRSMIDTNTTDEYAYYPPNGTRFVVVQWSVTNTGDQAVDLRPAMFSMTTNGTTYGYQPLAGATGFEETTVGSGESYQGWTAFAVPTNESVGTIGISQGALVHPVSVQFAENQALSLNTSA